VQAEHGPGPYPELRIVHVHPDTIRKVDIRTLLRFYESIEK